MNWASLLQLLPVLLQAVEVAKSIEADRHASSGLSVTDTIQKEAPAVINIFSQLGAALFPNVTQAQQPIAAATALNVDVVKKIQTALNERGATPPLVVDGQYGPKTKAAVTAFQSANGLQADGWAGPLTQHALNIA